MSNFLLVWSMYGFLENRFYYYSAPAWRTAGEGIRLGIYPQYRSDAAGLHPRFDPCLLDTDA